MFIAYNYTNLSALVLLLQGPLIVAMGTMAEEVDQYLCHMCIAVESRHALSTVIIL